MASKSKKILITRKSHEVFIVRGQKGARREVCAECEKEVEMLTLDSAVQFSKISMRRLVQMAENGEIHFREDENGSFFYVVCHWSVLSTPKNRILKI
jgi:hypothetical protein